MRYQSGPGEPGVMDTERWFSALVAGIDGPLGDVLDVGAAEGVMCVLAAQRGATAVTGIGLHDDRMTVAWNAAKPYPQVEIRERDAREYTGSHQTVVFSMMAHWLGANETARYARIARKWFCVVFRTANEHYQVPENGTWFPTFAEMDETVGGIRTHEELLLVQDHGKEVWAATYRTDMHVEGFTVVKGNTRVPLLAGRDLHGDPPFRPTHGANLAILTEDERRSVERLVYRIAKASLRKGTYPSDFSPRNVIVNDAGAFLIDDEPEERAPGPIVAPEYLPIWQRTLSTVGIDFDGDLRSLL